MSVEDSAAVATARDYYNSDDADAFYRAVWGGEDIHIGLYESEADSIATASRRTVERMAGQISSLGKLTRALDLGSGYGGSARYLARTYGCHVTALNLSEVENDRNRRLCREQNLEDLIDVKEGNFEHLPFADQSFDLVWSQDAFLHSGQREAVLQEAARVMKPGADLVFTDPMQADDCPAGVLQPILDRIHLETLASPGFYRQTAAACGLRENHFADLTVQLSRHYARVLAETEGRQADLQAHGIHEDYLERMKRGLQHWVDGGRSGYLCWGIFHFQRA